MIAETPGGPVGTFLIVLKQVVVAQDIALTLSDLNPAAQVVVASSHSEALAALAAVSSVALAIVNDGPQSFPHSDLCHAITLRGGRVVLVGTEAEDAGEAAGWQVLHRPFTSDAVLALLKPVSV